MEFEVRTIKPLDEVFWDVLRLHKENKQTLGFLPQGAFEDASGKGYLLGAVTNDDILCGYLLFRKSRSEISITHLCVGHLFRGSGIAEALVEYLKRATKDYHGIGLWCRRDYEAHKMWPKFGFKARAEKPAKSRNGKVLVKWWFDNGHDTLFTYAAKRDYKSSTSVVIDSCVFFGLIHPDDKYHNLASALQADWLLETIDILITPEIYIDIDRNPNPEERQYAQRHASTMIMQVGEKYATSIFDELKSHFPDMKSKQDLSDLKHIAYTITYGSSFFVTTDEALYKMNTLLKETYGVQAVHPAELIARVDEFIREQEYSPIRVAGTHVLQRERVGSEHLDELTQRFLCFAEGERKTKFARVIQGFLSNPRNSVCFKYTLDGISLVGLMGYRYSSKGEMIIEVLRACSKQLAPTITRFLISEAIRNAIDKNNVKVRITELRNISILAGALEEQGFVPCGDEWVKLCINKIASSSEIIQLLKDCAENDGDISGICSDIGYCIMNATDSNDSRALNEIEHLLFPAKIVDSSIQTYLVPIKPQWALHLFDEGIASQDLFGASEKLALNQESVYYKSVHSTGGISEPGRILWYLSYDKRYSWTSSVRACSRIIEVVRGSAKSIYNRFERLGVYEWEHILSITHDDPMGEILAIRFDDTELLPIPLGWSDLKEVLEDRNCPGPVRAPRKITGRCFEDIYRKCKGLV